MIAALRPHLPVFLGLLVLLGLTATGASFPLGPFNLPLSLAIAFAMMLLLAIFFMELRSSSTLIRLVSAVGLFWIAILFMLALADYLTRYPGDIFK